MITTSSTLHAPAVRSAPPGAPPLVLRVASDDRPVTGTPVRRAASVNDAQQSSPSQCEVVRVPRPVDEHRAALDEVHVHGAPVAAVVRVVAIVTHHEVAMLGNAHRRLVLVERLVL